jgi:hypothetical protein
LALAAAYSSATTRLAMRAQLRVISILLWPSSAAIASSRMPRLIGWVARVCRCRCGCTPGDVGDAADPVDDPANRVPVERAAVVGAQTLIDPGCALDWSRSTQPAA